MRSKSIPNLIISEITAVGVNVVPLALWFFEDYSAATTMVLYWLESVVAVILAVVCIRLLAPATERLADANKTLVRREMVGSFLMIAGMLALILGVFVSFFIFGILKAEVTFAAVKFGMMFIAAFQFFEFFSNLFLLRPLSLKQGEIFLSRSLGRLAVLFFSVFIGMFLAAFVEDWFVLPFIVLKTIVDVGEPIQSFMGKHRKFRRLPPK